MEDSSETTSYWKMAKSPSVWIVSLVLATATSTQGYLDPTVEPHFREFGLTPEYVGLIFLVMSAAYALSSPVGGWFASKIKNKAPMMFIGLVITAFGYILLGPANWIGLTPSLWLSTGAMLILGLAYSLAFIPTFEALLDTVIDSGANDSVRTYSLVSGWWSCFNNLGELAGAALGGLFMDLFGFANGAGIVALWTAVTATILGVFYIGQLFTASCCPSKRIGSRHSSCVDGERSPLMGQKTSCGITYRDAYTEPADSCECCEESVTILGRLSAYRHKKSAAWRKTFLLTL